jgi:serine/threonine-protein kinase
MSDPQAPALPKHPFAEPPRDGNRGAVSKHVCCRLAAGSGPGFTDEMSSLLRTRLRLAVFIILVGITFRFLRNLLLPESALDHRALRLIFNGCEITVMVIASALLWSRRPLSIKSLRILELTVFGTIAVFLAWLQVDTYHDGTLVRAFVTGHEAVVFRLVGVFIALPWFVLIVLYGTFIPNTPWRCAAVVVSLAALPVALLVAGSQLDPTPGPFMLLALPEMALLIATAVAIAVFGSHKIGELHKKAHEAQRIGQYRLKDVLGFGGMGTVYLAEHVLLRRPCAVKVIRPDKAGDPRALGRFEREVQATATLTHPNTIEIYDYGHAEDGTFYYVMEYLPGMNLEDMVQRHGTLLPERVIHLLRQVCQALNEAHGIGLIHRDIKPSNVLACERGKVYDVAKLLDFGLVKAFGTGSDAVKLTGDGTFTGSAAFTSPEQALGRPRLDARSDIYNIGAVAYYLLTSELLFECDSTLGMLHAQAYQPIIPVHRFRETVPADLQRVILRCLEKDPDRRYPDVLALDKALASCECSARWTAVRAEEWWQRHGSGTASPSAPADDPRLTPGDLHPEVVPTDILKFG